VTHASTLHLAGLAALAVLATAPDWARACWEEAAQRYGISADLLYAIARVESNLNPQAVNRSHLQRTGSYDIGLMQINSGHLRTLSRHGIKEADLFDPCTNIRVGAWLLADSFSRRGATWDAVGAYNAACSQLKGKDCIEARANTPGGCTASYPRNAARSWANTWYRRRRRFPP
jgi:soluble lytic murein transglycosylase-like protein